MNKNLAKFLQGIVVLIGLAALVFLLWEPQLEGRNAQATLFEIYFRDPFLAFAYLGSIAFFLALYHAVKVLGRAGAQRLRSPEAARSLKAIRHCALVIIGFVLIGEVFIVLHESDDRAGGVAMGVLIAFGSTIAALVATMLERVARGAKPGPEASPRAG